MSRRASDTIGGTLRPNDPRRFLVEAMLCATAADGNIDDRELAVVHKHLDNHELFSGLSERNQQVLLELARDALKFAKKASARIPAIAAGLPGRIHRVTALAMACEIVVVDGSIDDAELDYLEQLRLALRIAPHEFDTIFEAAKNGRSSRDLDARVTRLRELIPVVCEVMALRGLMIRRLDPDHRNDIHALLAALPDMSLRDNELETLVNGAFAKMHVDLDVEGQLQRLAESKARDPIDRYWIVVYALCAEHPSTLQDWRANTFIRLLQRVFAFTDPYIQLAAQDAAGFAMVPRPRP